MILAMNYQCDYKGSIIYTLLQQWYKVSSKMIFSQIYKSNNVNDHFLAEVTQRLKNVMKL